MEVQRLTGLVSPAAHQGGWQSVGLIALSVIASVSADGVSFEAASGDEGSGGARTRPRADGPGREL